MPTYQYACNRCGHRFDIVQGFHEDSLDVCPDCGESALRKLFGNVGVVFKGSGFYRTDSRAAGKAGGGAGSGSGSGSGSGAGSGAQPAATGAAGSSTGSGGGAGSAPAPAKATGTKASGAAQS